jgi:hypothetical protein
MSALQSGCIIEVALSPQSKDARFIRIWNIQSLSSSTSSSSVPTLRCPLICHFLGSYDSCDHAIIACSNGTYVSLDLQRSFVEVGLVVESCIELELSPDSTIISKLRGLVAWTGSGSAQLVSFDGQSKFEVTESQAIAMDSRVVCGTQWFCSLSRDYHVRIWKYGSTQCLRAENIFKGAGPNFIVPKIMDPGSVHFHIKMVRSDNEDDLIVVVSAPNNPVMLFRMEIDSATQDCTNWRFLGAVTPNVVIDAEYLVDMMIVPTDEFIAGLEFSSVNDNGLAVSSGSWMLLTLWSHPDMRRWWTRSSVVIIRDDSVESTPWVQVVDGRPSIYSTHTTPANFGRVMQDLFSSPDFSVRAGSHALAIFTGERGESYEMEHGLRTVEDIQQEIFLAISRSKGQQPLLEVGLDLSTCSRIYSAEWSRFHQLYQKSKDQLERGLCLARVGNAVAVISQSHVYTIQLCNLFDLFLHHGLDTIDCRMLLANEAVLQTLHPCIDKLYLGTVIDTIEIAASLALLHGILETKEIEHRLRQAFLYPENVDMIELARELCTEVFQQVNPSSLKLAMSSVTLADISVLARTLTNITFDTTFAERNVSSDIDTTGNFVHRLSLAAAAADASVRYNLSLLVIILALCKLSYLTKEDDILIAPRLMHHLSRLFRMTFSCSVAFEHGLRHANSGIVKSLPEQPFVPVLDAFQMTKAAGVAVQTVLEMDAQLFALTIGLQLVHGQYWDTLEVLLLRFQKTGWMLYLWGWWYLQQGQMQKAMSSFEHAGLSLGRLHLSFWLDVLFE